MGVNSSRNSPDEGKAQSETQEIQSQGTNSSEMGIP